MNEIYKKQLEVVCSVVLILLAVLIPRYVKLPKNIKLLFNDRISQVLLLALVILIVIYNFLCGVLLFVFFASMMIFLRSAEGISLRLMKCFIFIYK